MLLNTVNSEENLTATTLTFNTHEHDDDNTLIRREYSFDYSKGWDTWTFSSLDIYEDDNPHSGEWEHVKHIQWMEPEGLATTVPSIVLAQLAELIGEDEVEKMKR